MREGKKPHGNEPKVAFFSCFSTESLQCGVFQTFLTVVKMIIISVEGEKT